jgi:hypothetical protein
MNSRSSIVDRLHFRSITGQRLGLDVHRCTKPRTRLLWNRNSSTGCYMNYIGRYEADYYVSQQIQPFFETFGMHDACSRCYIKCRCCNIHPTYLDDRFGKICIYIDPKVLAYPLYIRDHSDCWDKHTSTCQCPGTYFLDGLNDVTMTSWCLNSSNLTIHGKCFVKSKFYSQYEVSNLIIRTGIPFV